MMKANLVNEVDEFKAWRLLGQVGAVSAMLGLVTGLGLGTVSHANAPATGQDRQDRQESVYAVSGVEHSPTSDTAQAEPLPPTF
jgi:hypothetical protein